MKKNVASQVIGAQMVSASDGSAFTGAVTVYVTGDGGTQAAGSVGSGACTHQGNGFHSYAPAQAETNYDHVAFTFIGTGAVPATVQAYPSFPQTGDSFARLGAPAGASVSADVAAIHAKTDNLPSDPADESSIQGALATIVGYIDTEVSAIKAVTDNLPDAGALTSLATAAALATVDTVVDAIQAKTDNLPASPAATGDAMTLTSAYDFAKGTVAMTQSYAANGTEPSPIQALYAIHQMLMDHSISSVTWTVRQLDGSTTAFEATLNDATTPSAVTRS